MRPLQKNEMRLKYETVPLIIWIILMTHFTLCITQILGICSLFKNITYSIVAV
jgi:hypothetical protein